MDPISFEVFKKISIRIGTIRSAEQVEGSEKLLKLEVDFGDSQRQIIAGIASYYAPEHLIGKQCPFVFNLELKMLKGLESQGMMLCADDGGPVLLNPDKKVASGSIVK